MVDIQIIIMKLDLIILRVRAWWLFSCLVFL